MYHQSYINGNRWENKFIDAKSKNSHRRSKDKIARRSSNSLKQEFRNEKFNLQLFNRRHANKTNKQYSLEGYLKSDSIYDDYDMILNKDYNHDYAFCCDNDTEVNITSIDIWQCSKCTYINIERLSHCAICGQSYHQSTSINGTMTDSNSIKSSDSDESITTYSSLSSYILKNNKPKKSRIRRRKICKKSNKNSFKFNDEEYKKFKKYMKKHKTSIIAYKKGSNNGNIKWNHKKEEKRKNNANKLFEMYHTLYLSTNKHKDQVSSIMNQMISFIPNKYLNHVTQQDTNTNTVCQVCYCDSANDDEMELIAMQRYCNHKMICKDCFIQHLNIAIRDDENILPFLLCPAPQCKAPIHIDLLLKYLSIDNLYKFGQSFINKHLQRCSYWIECPDTNDKKCKFGWILINNNMKKDNNMIELKCESCGCDHRIEENEMKNNEQDAFSSMIESGLMRTCPQCDYPAMKDYGLCNVMHCGKCRIYWNWRSKEMGHSSTEIKQKARNNGTLWEPGELSYQQGLQNNNLPAFIALLARNGIKYDPNYRRGS